MKTAQSTCLFLPALGLALTLAACGGGGGSTGGTGATTPSGGTATPSAATSSGEISAFGSVFVNGHEFATGSAQVVDDDSGDTTATVAGLEVGQVVDVQAATDSTSANPAAAWLHVHPLARGYVDALDSSGGTLSVMGQAVSLDSATLFSDHRACVGATTNACTAVTDATGLVATTSAAGATVAGTYVSVDGYLFNAGSGSANIVATLVSVHDVPTSTNAVAAFKVEGTASAVGTTSVTIGGLSIGLAQSTCRVDGKAAACAGAFAVGDVVSAFSATAPTLPATSFAATIAIKRSHLPVQTAGAVVEFDGSVSSFTAASGSSAASFVVRGVKVDTSALAAGTSLPAVGDIVRVTGTVSSDGLSVAASAIHILHAALSASYALAGDVSAVAAGASASTFTVTVLGEPVVVSDQTRLADRQAAHWFSRDPQSDPFNISTFQTYLAASSSQHVVVKAARDSSGTLQAQSLTIAPASTASAIAGPVDASPAPVAGTSTAPATFSIDGVPVSAATSAITYGRHAASAIAAGDEVTAWGTFASGVLGVAATRSPVNFVFDLGTPGRHDMPLF